ncbi:MAG: hypothetical protein JJE47_16410 [Acidimicrobiia bacterium]|nr:hypothetical protein [Acidimicrobiia bacterium]
MDIAVNLVESYLRLNGYLTLSEMEVQKKTQSGLYETLTDVDIVALRFPGQIFAADPHDEDDCRMLLINDDVLELVPETIDVIVGEVKQGEAVFNPGLTRHEVLHTVLHRVEWIYAAELDEVIGQVTESGVSMVAARSGGLVRTRLVAFGRADASNLNAVSLSHIVEAMVRFMDEFDDVLRPAQFKEPAQAFLRLLAKTGFSVTKEG